MPSPSLLSWGEEQPGSDMSVRPSPSLSEPSAHAAGGGGGGAGAAGAGAAGGGGAGAWGGAGQVLPFMITPLQQMRSCLDCASASVIRSPARSVPYIKPSYPGRNRMEGHFYQSRALVLEY